MISISGFGTSHHRRRQVLMAKEAGSQTDLKYHLMHVANTAPMNCINSRLTIRSCLGFINISLYFAEQTPMTRFNQFLFRLEPSSTRVRLPLRELYTFPNPSIRDFSLPNVKETISALSSDHSPNKAIVVIGDFRDCNPSTKRSLAR